MSHLKKIPISSPVEVNKSMDIIADNIAIIILGILALIALMIALMYSKKGKKKK